MTKKRIIILLLSCLCIGTGQLSAQGNFGPPKVATQQNRSSQGTHSSARQHKENAKPQKNRTDNSSSTKPATGTLSADYQQLSNYELELKASDGDARAQYTLGKRWVTTGDSTNVAKGVNWLKAAAWQGLPDAQYAYGYLLYHGYGVDRNRTSSRQWMRRAAEGGSQKARKFLNANKY